MNNKIRQLAVKIYIKNNVAIGTGTLFCPKDNEKYAYVITAAHVAVKGIDDKYLLFKMVVDEEEKSFEIDNTELVKLHKGFDRHKDIKENDVAVIKVLQEKWMKELPELTIGDPNKEDLVEGQGFPVSAKEPNLKFALMDLEGKIGTCSEENKRFQLKLSNILRNPSDELPGYSGSGIFEKRNEELILVGIFSYGQGKKAIQNITNAFYSSLIKDIAKESNWDIPKISNQVPESFDEFIEEATDIIENDEIRNAIVELINYFINQGLKPYLMIKNNNYYVPKCNYGNRMKCKVCWISYIRLISIIAMMTCEDYDICNPKVIINNNSIPIDFFCSEGKDGKTRIRKVVRSLFDEGLVWKNKFREDAILIWASEITPTTEVMTRTEFSRLIGDICKEPVSKIKSFDTMFGEGKNNNLSIVHIHKLLQAVDVEKSDKVNKKLEDVFRDAIQ